MGDAAIMVEGLRKNYGEVVALQGVDFEVPVGTIFGLLGPNGAGKTTTVRILSTIIRADGGHAEVMGHDVSADPVSVRFQIGLAGQSASVDANLTGRENLVLVGMLAQIPKRLARSRADELLERFFLSDAAGRPLRTYSGGMRRRLDVAAALIARPPVLFLDEPTTGLDIQSRTELWEVIRELVRDGSTVLLTTQYLEEADRLAGRIAVIDKGTVVANDTTTALKARLGSTTIELEMGSVEEAIRADELVGHVCTLANEIEGKTVRMGCVQGPQALIETLRVLGENGLEPVNLEVREPTLDEVFLALTGEHPLDGGSGPASKDGG